MASTLEKRKKWRNNLKSVSIKSKYINCPCNEIKVNRLKLSIEFNLTLKKLYNVLDPVLLIIV